MVARGSKIRSVAWDRLRGSLQILKNTTSIFPQLSSAISSLLSCLDEFEAAARSRQDFEDLATELATLSDTLNQYIHGPSSIFMSGSVKSISISIENQAKEVRERLSRGKKGGIRGIQEDEELLRYYRRIQTLFRQLQTNANSNTWKIANEHLANTRLESLNPVKQAVYDSGLSTEINRRGCTEGTRTRVLGNLDHWQIDHTSQPILWMNGMAGTGKTAIAWTFCERLEKRNLLAANFFCTHSSADVGVLAETPDIGSKKIPIQFERLLKEPLQQVKDAIPEHLVVVIDALDECEDRNGVKLFLEMLFRHAPQLPLKFLVTGRPVPDIYGKMMDPSRPREIMSLHEVENSVVRNDIELYFKEQLASMALSSVEISQLVERSGALFVYASNLVDYVQSGKRSGGSHKRLQSLFGTVPGPPKSHLQVDALYKAVLESALNEDERESDERAETLAALRVVLSAHKPIVWRKSRLCRESGMCDEHAWRFYLYGQYSIRERRQGLYQHCTPDDYVQNYSTFVGRQDWSLLVPRHSHHVPEIQGLPHSDVSDANSSVPDAPQDNDKMVRYASAALATNPEKTARARGEYLRTHFKNMREVAAALTGLKLTKAYTYLDNVKDHKQVIPFRRFAGGVGRASQAKEFGATQGASLAEKSIRFILRLLKNAESNADAKNLELEELIIKNIVVQQAPIILSAAEEEVERNKEKDAVSKIVAPIAVCSLADELRLPGHKLINE
ncbi:universal ribosomal protein uL22 family [Rhizoctonia solani]|uniref:Universal ribosomal protein uL22 family n=1 Tax=Rhizoctonia solani TaxID=456999 RepID=A0A8H7M5D6_9AGAM|nr:universal ribosomal protein uL22 family [Rhizoctonia solani]